MEEQIKKLKELADEYARFAGRTPIERHVIMQYGNSIYDEISLYFTKDREYSIGFEKVEIAEYKNTIEMPLNYTAETLEKIYNDVKKFLDEKKEQIKEQAKKEREQEIEKLKMKLAQMEKENND